MDPLRTNISDMGAKMAHPSFLDNIYASSYGMRGVEPEEHFERLCTADKNWLNNSPKDIGYECLETGNVDYRKRVFADAGVLMTLRWGNYCGLSGWAYS